MRSRTALSNVEWRKSSYSGSNGGDCVEVAENRPTGTVPVRDSKNPAVRSSPSAHTLGRRSSTACVSPHSTCRPTGTERHIRVNLHQSNPPTGTASPQVTHRIHA